MGYNMGQVLGELLSSIVTARNTADRASRDLALQYEKDELMRVFPVPFVEVQNVEVELKFAFEDTSDVEGPLPYIVSNTDSGEEGIAMPLPDSDPIPSPLPPRPLPVPVYQTPMNLIMLQANELANLPPECLSSIKITLNVSNYEWSIIDRKDGVAPTRKLVRE